MESAVELAMETSRVDSVVLASYSVQSQEIQAQRIVEVAKRTSRSDESAAKQLTNYQSWMSTSELNSNGENDKKPAKEKDAISHTVETVVQLRSLGVLTAAGCGIGSVHAVVRSNLLVEPSEVEEGEM
ncbi:rop guanine nucleotide exchange factor 12-like [Dorcoceras hygrometricum]|uniref:Rop guanine nucleotide exchange factor 12-like n=1 Tax=Dorcoceras hygrometricum TaxID=472368 RepID=A0A2Z7BQ06_9LAMI|nr:rop guanine nucleotide exchange factor 12-like [Dorcoceras hygrometricum]